MASSFSTDLKLELMVTGEKAGQWGDITNTNLNLLQQAIAGYQEVNIAGGAQTTTLVMSDAALSNARNAVIKLTGTITGNQVVTVPTGIEKTYIVENGTSGAFTVEFKQDGGTGTTFSTTDKGVKFLYANGTNIIDINANLAASSFEQINLPTQNELRFEDASGGQYVALKAGTTVASNVTFTLPTADGTSGQALTTNGSGVLSFATAGRTGAVNWDTTAKTTTVTAADGVGYFINTTSGAITVNLPAGSAGAIVALADYAATWNTNNVTVTPNGTDKIGGVNANATLNTQGQAATFVYVDSTQGWTNVGDATKVTGNAFVAATGGTITTCGNYKIHTFTGPGTFTVTNAGTPAGSATVDYMVVAGGASGGANHGGGGGAGGFRESVPSPAAWTASPLANPGGALPVSVQGYPITVGGGGAASANPGNPSIFSTITSAGGGRGGTNCFPTGGTGGSGGGGWFSNPGSAGNTPPTSPPQGSSGGASSPVPGAVSGGGGGGATATGTTSGPAGSPGGAGGTGATSSINGTPTGRAGGGGGGAYSGNGGTASQGGGAGGPGAPNPGTPGTVNTGGGGGGGSVGGNAGGAGGSGIVIIRYKFQ